MSYYKLTKEWDTFLSSPELRQLIHNVVQGYMGQMRGRSVTVGQGFDVSTHGQATNQILAAEDFVTLGDLLEVCNGATRPTYVSGAGLAAETYQEQFVSDLEDVQKDWLIRHGYVDEYDPSFANEDAREHLMEEAKDMEWLG